MIESWPPAAEQPARIRKMNCPALMGVKFISRFGSSTSVEKIEKKATTIGPLTPCSPALRTYV